MESLFTPNKVNLKILDKQSFPDIINKFVHHAIEQILIGIIDIVKVQICKNVLFTQYQKISFCQDELLER